MMLYVYHVLCASLNDSSKINDNKVRAQNVTYIGLWVIAKGGNTRLLRSIFLPAF